MRKKSSQNKELAHMARVMRTRSSLVDDSIEEELGFSPLRDDTRVFTRKRQAQPPAAPASSLSLLEMRQKNEAFLIDQKSLPLVQQLLDDIDTEKLCTQLALMTPYSDAAWMATMWPCQRHHSGAGDDLHHQCSHECNRTLLHDGTDWYLWNDQIRRWELVDQLMYRLVAEHCTLLYRRLYTTSRTQVKRLASLHERGHLEDTEMQCHLNGCRSNLRHLERLHSLAYQKKVLDIAGKIFFSLPSGSKGRCWGPSRDLLPLHDGTVLHATEDGRLVKRQAFPGDRLNSTTPTLPRADPVFVPMGWTAKWRATDLRQLQCILGHALLSSSSPLGEDPRSCRALILWGVDEETRHRFVSFLRAVVGPHYCSFTPPRNIHTRIAVEALLPRSEQHLLSSSFRQDLVTRVENSLLGDILNILIVGSVQNRICALPVDPPHHCTVLTPIEVGMIRAGDRFWGTAAAPPSTSLCLTHEDDDSLTKIAIIGAEPLTWLLDGTIIH